MISFNAEHPLKASCLISLTDAGIVMLVSDEQPSYLQPVITQYFVRNKSEMCHRPLRVHSKGWRFNDFIDLSLFWGVNKRHFFSFQHFWWLIPIIHIALPFGKRLVQRYDISEQWQRKAPLKILLFWRECSLPLATFLCTLMNSPPKEIRMVCEVGWTPISHAIVVSTISSVVCPRCRMQFQASRWMEKGFWAVYSPTEEETDQNGLPLDLYTFKRGWLPLHPT